MSETPAEPTFATIQQARNMVPSVHPSYAPDAWRSVAAKEHRAGRDLAEAASELTAGYELQIRHVEQDPELSEAGKARKIADLRARAASVVDAYESFDNEMQEADLASLHSALRRPEPNATGAARFTADLAHRDALDRSEAAAAKDGARGLLALFERATRSGDSTLARAAFSTALDRWDSSSVIDRWLDLHPEDAPKLARLREIESRKGDVQAGFFRAVRYRRI